MKGKVKDGKVCRLADHGVELRILVGNDAATAIMKPINCRDGSYREKVVVKRNPFYSVRSAVVAVCKPTRGAGGIRRG